MNGMLTRSPEWSEVQPSSAKTIRNDGQGEIWSVGFPVDGKHVVSGGDEGKIRRWRVEDGMEVGAPMVAGGPVCNIAVSRDGKWIVCGAVRSVQVWNADNSKKVTEIRGGGWVNAVDVSPDSMKIASGSEDRTASVWSLSTGQRLLGPWKHDDEVFGVKFSPDGRFIATTTWNSILIYDSSSRPQSKSLPRSTTPSPGRAITNTSLPYLPARSPVSTPPLVQRFLSGPFMATVRTALHWQAMAHSSQPLPAHRSRSGTLRHTSESDLSSSIQLMSTAWPCR